MSEIDQGRRKFLGTTSAVIGGLAIAPGMFLIDLAHGQPVVPTRPAGTPASSAVRWGMLIDTTRCKSDCDDCVTACQKENGWHSPKTAQDVQWIRKVELEQESTGKKVSLPMMCQHCAEPPCVDVCPTAASFKRADGIVLVDRHLCIGCRYCMMACPYQARSFEHHPVEDHESYMPRGQGTVESCTLCVQRVDSGQQPACVEACGKNGSHALLFGDLNDPNSEISQRIRSVTTTKLRADLGLNTGFSFVGL